MRTHFRFPGARLHFSSPATSPGRRSYGRCVGFAVATGGSFPSAQARFIRGALEGSLSESIVHVQHSRPSRSISILRIPCRRLADAASRGRVAGTRLLLIGGEAVALLLAFAALAAAATRRESALTRWRLERAGARAFQTRLLTGTETVGLATVATLVGWGLGIGVGAIVARVAGGPVATVLVQSAASETGIVIALALAVVAAGILALSFSAGRPRSRPFASLCRGRGCLRGAGDYRASPRARSRGRGRTRARAGDRLDAFRTTPSRRLRCRSRCCARVSPCCSPARTNNSEPVGSRPPRRAFACAASCTVDRGFNLPARERRSGRVLARVPIDTRSGPGRPSQIRESDRSDCPEPATSPCSPPRRPVTAGRSLALAEGSSTSTAPGWSGGAAFALYRSCRDFCLDPPTPSLLA